MRLLLDSHVLIALAEERSLTRAIDTALRSRENHMVISAASLWEIAIKFRLGKLKLTRPPDKLPTFFRFLGYQLLVVDHRHAVEELLDQPATRDPFDRLLLAQCQVEGLRLVTTDRALVNHPLAWRAA
jgi:PIN domain nuclease of toxin-antitoxin system